MENVEEIFLIGDREYGDDPKIYDQTISNIDSEKWLEARKTEIDLIHFNQVQTLVDPLEGIVSIECKWIYKKKLDSDGKVEVYKTRLIAKCYSQCKSIDYQEHISPVAMLKSI